MKTQFIMLPKAKELLDNAIKQGAKESRKGKKHPNKFIQARKEHIVRIKRINNYLNEKISNCLDKFPTFEASFFTEMVSTIIELNELKKILSHLNKMRKLAYGFSRKYSSMLYNAQNERQIISLYRQFLGRLFSLEKDLDKSITKLNKIIPALNKIPNIKEEKAIILAGFPNTGKTTILSRLTKSRPKIAAYAFTTKDLMIGYFEERFSRILIIDTPGLLDKEKEKRNKIEQKTINALKHLAKAIFFVIDPTEQCGFSLEKQLELLGQLKEFGVPIIAIVNKTDIASKKQIDSIKTKEKIVLSGNEREKQFRQEIAEEIKRLKI